MARGLPDPSKAFCQHKSNARARGIAWEMTFDQWWGIWKDYYHLRGRGTNGLVMARENDVGPYAVGNVHLTTTLGNVREYHQSGAAKRDREDMRVRQYEKRVSRGSWWAKRSFEIDNLPPWHDHATERNKENA